MKKLKVFFIVLLAAVTLLGFSGTSHAFDFSKITAKPAELYRYVIQKLGFGDDEEDIQKAGSTEASEQKKSEVLSGHSAENSGYYYADTFTPDSSVSLFTNNIEDSYLWLSYNEEPGYNYGSESWYLRIGSRTGEIFTPFSDESSYVSLWQTKVEYLAALPWDSLSRLNAELFIESAFSQTPDFGSDGLTPDYMNEPFNSGPENTAYGLRIDTSVKNVKIGLYGRYVNNAEGSNGTASLLDNSGLIQNYDHWKIGMAYEGRNSLDWLNTYGINWGVGYNYTVTLDDLNLMDSLRQGNSSHSGSITANTYWFNMRLYTMFMYLYDRETRGSMTVLNATYSPDWRWSYGIRANIYYGRKDAERKLKGENPEVVTFTATYRWD